MGKQQKPQAVPFGLDVDALRTTPLTLLGPWLSAQAGLLGTWRAVTEHWYERRAADLAILQGAVSDLAGCSTPDGLAEAQMRCGTAIADRLVADFTGWRDDLVSLGASAASALGTGEAAGADGKGS